MKLRLIDNQGMLMHCGMYRVQSRYDTHKWEMCKSALKVKRTIQQMQRIEKQNLAFIREDATFLFYKKSSKTDTTYYKFEKRFWEK